MNSTKANGENNGQITYENLIQMSGTWKRYTHSKVDGVEFPEHASLKSVLISYMSLNWKPVILVPKLNF